MKEESNYASLSDDEMIKIGIDFTARGLEMPVHIRTHLISLGLYEAIINPKDE